MKRAILVAFLLSLCAAAAQDVGSITIFRTSDHKRGWKPIAYCDGQRIAAMQGGKYVTMNVSAGRHTFSTNNTKGGLDVDVKPGGQYFLRVSGTTLSEGNFEVADPAQSREMIERMEPLKPTEVTGGVCRTPRAGGQ